MTAVLPTDDAALAAWFAKLEQLEEPKRTQMLTWVKQEFARERSLRTHANAGELAASLDPAWYITSFNPAMAAKGSFVGSTAGRRFRTEIYPRVRELVYLEL